MAEQKVFSGVTAAIFSCVKTNSQKDRGTKYEYLKDNPNAGTATTKGRGWEVVLNFVHDPDKGVLTYTKIRKTFYVPISEVWSGIENAIESCRKKGT